MMDCTLINAQFKPIYYTTAKGNDYVRVPIRMHIHFNPITVPMNEGIAYAGSVYAPYHFVSVSPKVIEPVTLNVEHYFFIKGNSDISADYISYLEHNIDKFSTHPVWEVKKQNLIKEYLDKIYRTCGVNINPESLDYSVQFCWKNIE
jgi:hypothetical protein